MEPSPLVPRARTLLFAKKPRAGFCKTRLGRSLGSDTAVRLATAFLADSIARIDAWGRTPFTLFGDRNGRDSFREWLPPTWGYEPQASGNLGCRLRAAFETCFDRDVELDAVIALGADTPHLPLSRLDDALAALADHDVVIGPSDDGGYYLIALRRERRLYPVLFDNELWGGDALLDFTRRQLRAAGCAFVELEGFWDIDEIDDLVKWRQDLRQAPMRRPRAEHSLAELRRIALPPGDGPVRG